MNVRITILEKEKKFIENQLNKLERGWKRQSISKYEYAQAYDNLEKQHEEIARELDEIYKRT